MSMSGQHSSMTGEWHTPPEIVDPARGLFDGFNLDPASCPEANRIVRAHRFYWNRGLERRWDARVLWCNAPSNGETSAWEWWVKGAQEFDRFNVERMFFLVFNPSSFFQVALTHSREMRLPTPQHAIRVEFEKRVRYLRPDGTRGDAPPHGSALLLLSRNHADAVHFGAAYRHLGECLRPVRRWRSD